MPEGRAPTQSLDRYLEEALLGLQWYVADRGALELQPSWQDQPGFESWTEAELPPGTDSEGLPWGLVALKTAGVDGRPGWHAELAARLRTHRPWGLRRGHRLGLPQGRPRGVLHRRRPKRPPQLPLIGGPVRRERKRRLPACGPYGGDASGDSGRRRRAPLTDLVPRAARTLGHWDAIPRDERIGALFWPLKSGPCSSPAEKKGKRGSRAALAVMMKRTLSAQSGGCGPLPATLAGTGRCTSSDADSRTTR